VCILEPKKLILWNIELSPVLLLHVITHYLELDAVEVCPHYILPILRKYRS